MNSIIKLDDLWMGRPRSIATALLESDGHRTIVDPGPGSTLETLRQGLRSRSISVSDLDAVLLTHIHLDHAGATGALVGENPRLAVYVHTNGARSEERRVGKECRLVTGVQTCALPISRRRSSDAHSSGPCRRYRRAGGRESAACRVRTHERREIGRASCRERVSIGDWSSDVCSSDLSTPFF